VRSVEGHDALFGVSWRLARHDVGVLAHTALQPSTVLIVPALPIDDDTDNTDDHEPHDCLHDYLLENPHVLAEMFGSATVRIHRQKDEWKERDDTEDDEFH